jgi:hypothetical protein
MAMGKKVPMQAAANTSVGQCTPSTSLDKPTRNIHKDAAITVIPWAAGPILRTESVDAVANAATARVWPLGKLAPQYHSVSQSVGRSRATKILIMTTTSAALICEAARRKASERCPARISNTAMRAVNGNRNFAEPVSVMAAKNGFRYPGT